MTGLPVAGQAARIASLGRADLGRVYVTRIFPLAVAYASMYAASGGAAGAGAVYEAGPVRETTSAWLAGLEVTSGSARVTRVVRACVRVADCPLTSPRAIITLAAEYGPVRRT
ncbi:MAG TPA: hypothetical protein VGM53_21985 [Streptosporangiaceae bacterium]